MKCWFSLKNPLEEEQYILSMIRFGLFSDDQENASFFYSHLNKINNIKVEDKGFKFSKFKKIIINGKEVFLGINEKKLFLVNLVPKNLSIHLLPTKLIDDVACQRFLVSGNLLVVETPNTLKFYKI